MTEDLDAAVSRLHAEGHGHKTIARELGVTPYAVIRAYARLGLAPQAPGPRPTGTARTETFRLRVTADELERIQALGPDRARAVLLDAAKEER